MITIRGIGGSIAIDHDHDPGWATVTIYGPAGGHKGELLLSPAKVAELLAALGDES